MDLAWRDWVQMEGDPGDPPEVVAFAERDVRAARKAHRCDCGGTIGVGSSYTRQPLIVDGEFVVVRTCAGCLDERDRWRPA